MRVQAEAVATDSQPISRVFTLSLHRIPSMPPWSQAGGHVTGQCSRASSSQGRHVSVAKPHESPAALSAKLSHPQHAFVGSDKYCVSSHVARRVLHLGAAIPDCHAPSSEREMDGTCELTPRKAAVNRSAPNAALTPPAAGLIPTLRSYRAGGRVLQLPRHMAAMRECTRSRRVPGTCDRIVPCRDESLQLFLGVDVRSNVATYDLRTVRSQRAAAPRPWARLAAAISAMPEHSQIVVHSTIHCCSPGSTLLCIIYIPVEPKLHHYYS